MRSDDCQRLRVEVRHVHCVTDRAFEQHGADRLRNFNAHALLRFRRRCAEMRRKNNIGRTAQRRIGRQRFNFENIQRAPATCPSRNACASAASSTRPPRAQLMMRTPRFVFINRAASRMWRVSAVSGVCSEMKSAPVSKSSSSSTSSTCRLRARVADR
jgi:hypothetical protein